MNQLEKYFRDQASSTVKSNKNCKIGDTFKIDTSVRTGRMIAHMTVSYFDDTGTPFMTYSNVHYTELPEDEDEACDRFQNGDCYPYPYDDINQLEKIKVDNSFLLNLDI